jgi:hypothetical protein
LDGIKNVDLFFRLETIFSRSSIAFLSEKKAHTSALKSKDKKSIF